MTAELEKSDRISTKIAVYKTCFGHEKVAFVTKNNVNTSIHFVTLHLNYTIINYVFSSVQLLHSPYCTTIRG